MRVYGSNAIRNVAFVGHGASGKTTLVDALAFVSGSSKRHGSIQDGTTLTDYSADEIDRKHSISLGVGFAEWMDTKINLLDAPGFLDFLGEATAALYSADAAVVVLNATGGVEVGTEKVWEICDRLHLPRLIFVTPDGPGAGQFRAGVRRREGAPLPQGGAGGDSGRQRRRVPAASSTCSPARRRATRRGPRRANTRPSRCPSSEGQSTRSTTSSWWRRSPPPTTRCSRSTSAARNSPEPRS